LTTHRLTLEYDGTDFHGWQFQRDRRTVEGALREALAAVGETEAGITAAGRTDAGAHAHGQIAGVTLHRDWTPRSLAAALNATLPADVAVVDATRSVPAFHARHDAVSRTYRYAVLALERSAPILRRHAWTVRGPLDVAMMRDAAASLVGVYDFGAFGSAPRPGGTTVRTVHDATVTTHRAGGLEMVVITVTANAFLRGMMRSLAGTLVAVGQGRMAPDAARRMLQAPKARPRSLTVAPARGLHQWAVTYPEAA